MKTHWIFLLLYLTSTPLFAQKYPHPDTLYRKDQIMSFLQKYQQKQDIRGLAHTYLAYAKSQEKWGNPEESPVESYRKSMDYFQMLHDSVNLYEVKGALGIYFMDKPVLQKYARDYLQSAVHFFSKTKQPVYELGHLVNLSNDHIHRFSLDTARHLLARANRLNQQVKNTLMQGRIDAALSDLYRHDKQYDTAIVYARKSLLVAQQAHVTWLEAVSWYYIGCSQHSLQQIPQALKSLERCKQLSTNVFYLFGLLEATYWELSQIYVEKKDYEQAYRYMTQATQTAQQSYYSKVGSDVRSYREYQLLETHKAELHKIALEKKLADAEVESLRARQKIYLLSILLACLLLAALAYTFIARQRWNSLQAEKVRKNLQIETLHALINGQELERLRIARELHDGVGTLLSRIKILVDSKKLAFDAVQQMLDDACEEIRTISGNLQPNALETFGLIRSIEDLVLKQHSDLPLIIFQYFGTVQQLSYEKNLMLYRIVQELLTNALKYAQAQEILIQINYLDTGLSLTVEDDGVGFQPDSVGTERNGWRNIRSRVHYLQGSLTLHTEAGTSVLIEIPYV